MKIEEKLKKMGLALGAASAPIANYLPVVRSGSLLFLAGHGPGTGGDGPRQGKLGHDLTVEQGYLAARQTALNLLATVKSEIGDLDKVQRIVKLLGMVNCTDDFLEQPRVLNGASDLLVELFGEKGRHARSAVGMNALPNNIPVEIEMIVEVEQ